MSIASDKNRYPTLSDSGRAMLQFIREHPNAPVFRNKSGNRLTEADIQALHAFDRRIDASRIVSAEPVWLQAFIEEVYEQVPHYRALGAPPKQLEGIPTIWRGNLSADIAQFVPDNVPTDRMMHFQTSGTTGHPLIVPSHPEVAGRYLSFHKRALKRFGIVPKHGRGQMGVILLGYQEKCFTYASVTPTMNESGLAKINLHPNDWRDLSERALFLDAMAPEIITGDPISFEALLDIDFSHKPSALISVAMTLTDGLRAALETRFRCPVLDIYSMNEAGPIGVFDETLGGHVLLQDQLHVEILDPDGKKVPDGAMGEITLTGGFNFCLPLMRYRTGDFGRLGDKFGTPIIMDLSGRPPVSFRTSNGELRNNVDVTHALKSLQISQYGLHQNKDGSLILSLAKGSSAQKYAAVERLKTLLGPLEILVDEIKADDKIVQYTSDAEST